MSGFWHGANWTFIIWGALNAIYFIPLLLSNRNRTNLDIAATGKYLPTIKEFMQIAGTFALTAFAWIFFRAENVAHALDIISKILSRSLFSLPEKRPTYLFILLVFFILIEWLGREHQYALHNLNRYLNKPLRITRYYIIIMLIFVFYTAKKQQFIYFQF